MKYIIRKIYRFLIDLFKKNATKQIAYIGENVCIPSDVIISGGENIYISNNSSFGSGLVLFATNAKICIKQYFVASHNLKIITGDHERRVGRFCGSITEANKNHNNELDKDVIINEDVWCGMNVIILKGVTIGRGCTICAGSIVTKSTPSYAIIGGVPAKFIKFYWTIDEIIRHEEIVYPVEERINKRDLEQMFKLYAK